MKIGDIEQGIPLQQKKHYGKWTSKFMEMKEGDSFLIESENGDDPKALRKAIQNIRYCACRFRERHDPKFQYAVRRLLDEPTKARFWRLG